MYTLLTKAVIPFSIASTHLLVAAALDNFPYQPCPLTGAYYPIPIIDRESDTIKAFSKQFTGLFDHLIANGGSEDFGEITPNTTSFSVVLFSGAEEDVEEPVFVEYHYTAPAAAAGNNTNVTLDTVFPLGGVTQLFTVYAWLAKMGDKEWDTPITKFLPELSAAGNSSSDLLAVPWEDVTIGALSGQLSGIARDSYACELGRPCDYDTFVQKFATRPPVFLPDTTPTVSNAAFQLLAFALERSVNPKCKRDAGDIFSAALLQPLNTTHTALLIPENEATVFGNGMNSSDLGEPAALSLLSTGKDLARLGHAMLSSRLVPAATTRRWLHPTASTSNLRNAVGRPWEIYHAGRYANSSVLDVYTKTGSVAGAYSSYFGLAPDFGAGFAILAHDSSSGTGVAPDLNVYADVVSLAITRLQSLAAKEAAARYAGKFVSGDDVAVFNISRDGPGLIVPVLRAGGVDLRAQVAAKAGIKLENLDFRVYPSNVATGRSRQFVAVFQDKSAPVDMGTPTCITWQDVGGLGPDVADRFVFEMGKNDRTEAVTIPMNGARLQGS